MSEHPAGPATGSVRLEPMTWDEFDVWAEHSVQGFAAQQVSAGLQPEAEATAYAREQFAELLPAGLATPLHLHWTVREDVPGRPTIGYLWLRVRALSSEVEAYVLDVELVEKARGRGLGRATMLAAERAARELDASVVRLNVFAHNVPARRLYRSLGYSVTSSSMTRSLAEADPALPEGAPRLRLREMTDAQVGAFRPWLEADYADNLVKSGVLPRVEARRKAAADLARLLPRGAATTGHLLWTAYREDAAVDRDGGGEVGVVWLQLRERSDGRHAFGLEMHVAERLRDRGYGQALLHAAEQACRERGVASVALSVFGHDDVARSLYESEGFVLTAQTMAKQV